MTDEEKGRWKADGFTQDQIDEIELGQEDGLDVSIYANKEYFALQMRQIRQGLAEGLEVSLYARPEYDWFQMEEIRKGMQRGVAAGMYADPSISYDRMRQIRKGLESGIDLSKYVKLDAGILRQFRKACIAKVNITDYIKEGYDPDQLEEIRTFLEQGIVAKPYLTPEFRGMAIRQICEGLAEGIDVSVYADPGFDWRQMQEIRLGLENRLDVSQYTHHLYSWQQMREIRLGLEEGLDVSAYKSFMYIASEMRKKRLELEEQPYSVENPVEEPDEGLEKQSFEGFQFKISKNEMWASLTIENRQGEISREEMKQALAQEHIRMGIDQNVLGMLEKGDYSDQTIQIAAGKPPQDGQDGRYEYFFRTSVDAKPKLLEDGSVDYHNVELFEMVKKGQKIAVYHAPSSGNDGYTVTGKLLHAKNGREQRVLTGNGFVIEPDGKTYTALYDGKIELVGDRIIISRLLVLDEVSLSRGNINFEGSVYVKGNVKTGSRLEASGDVIVDGYVEDAIIECGGNVFMRGGMHAGGNGYIRSAGSVTGKFFEAARIHATKDILADYSMNCQLYAEEMIRIAGANGSLMGGSSTAQGGITADNIGNRAGILTQIKIGVNDTVKKQLQSIEEQISGVENELQILCNAHGEFIRKYPAEKRNAMPMFLKIENAIYTKEKEKEELQEQKEEQEKRIEKMKEAKVVVNNTLYEGCSVTVNGAFWAARTVQAVTIKNIKEKIVVRSNR